MELLTVGVSPALWPGGGGYSYTTLPLTASVHTRGHTPVVLHEFLIVFKHEPYDKEEVLHNAQFVTGHGGELSKELLQSAIPEKAGRGRWGRKGGGEGRQR